MSGDLNVAVAPFTIEGHAGEEGVALARDVAKQLGTELPHLDPSLDVEVRGPRAVGVVKGSTSESQARSARQLAQAIGADVVVYGKLVADPQRTRLQPAFYLNAAKLPSATALGGEYAYGDTIAVPYALAVSPVARARVRAALVRRTEIFAQSFIGVGYYLLHALPSAEAHLRKALLHAPTGGVVALLRLLQGNIAAQQGRTVAAERDYSLAGHQHTVRVRAQLGLAEIRYEVAHMRCRAGELSLGGLDAARRNFSAALHTLGGIKAARSGSPLAGKAAFGEGQVDLCLSAAGRSGRWLPARREFAAAITAYRPDLPELRDDVAEAHAGIGLYDLSVERAPRAYEDARREYRVAAGLTTLRIRRAYFDGAIGFADAHLGDYSAAVEMYGRGVHLAGATALGQSLTRRASRLEAKAEVSH